MAKKVSPRKQKALTLIAKRYAVPGARALAGCNSKCNSKCHSR